MKKRCWEMLAENPWKAIQPPSIVDTVNARRVNAELPWDFYWARSVDRRVLLTLRHHPNSSPTNPLPELSGIEVSLSPPDGTNSRILAFKLLDTNHRDIFHILCQDIISAASLAESESEAVSVALMRTWRWHHLLRGGGGTLLSAQAQMGLLGELLVLERYFLPNLAPRVALTAWRGPLDAPKDFEVGRVAVETKARRGGAASSVAITSADQLDQGGLDLLFLYVVELSPASTDSDDSQTVQDMADRIRRYLANAAPDVLDVFEMLLLATGLRPEDDYSGYQWLEGSSHIFLVDGEFPRIVPSELKSGVSWVRYSVSLSDCDPYIASENDLVGSLGSMGGSFGD